MLTVNEEPLGPRRQHPGAESSERAVADVVAVLRVLSALTRASVRLTLNRAGLPVRVAFANWC